MIAKIRAALVGLVLSTSAAVQAQDFPFGQFQQTTLAARVSELNSGVTDEKDSKGDAIDQKPGNMVIMGPILRWRTSVIYTGQHRAADAPISSFIADYEKAHRFENSTRELYHDVYLFQEDGIDYWLPVQDPVASFFTKELKPGDPITIYLGEIGGFMQTEGWTWVFPVEEFDAGKK